MNTVDLFTLARLEPISSLLEDQIAELAAQTAELPLPAGYALFRAGDEESHLIYLLEGEVEIKSPDGEVHRVVSGSPQSRRPLDENSPRRVTAVALTPILYIRIDRELVDTMLAWAQSASSDTEEVIMSGSEILCIDKGELKRKMQHSPNFRKLPAANIDQVLERMDPARVEAGEVIIRQGEEGDYFYVIEKGEAMVTRVVEEDEALEESVEMADLGEGAAFGEAALISNKPRNATVSMQTDGVLLRLNKEDFLALMQEPLQDWLDYEAAKALVAAGACWVDVRARSEFQHGHLPGAINVPLNESHRQAQQLDKSKHYICYCPTGRRSSAAAFILTQYGLKASVIKGGLPASEMVEPAVGPQAGSA